MVIIKDIAASIDTVSRVLNFDDSLNIDDDLQYTSSKKKKENLYR